MIRRFGIYVLAAAVLIGFGVMQIARADCPPEVLIGDNMVPGDCL